MGPAGLTVVGGGPAGCAAAATARAAGMEVVLYAAGPSTRARPAESLPPGSTQLVDEIFGVGTFRPDDHLPAYANRSVWGSDDLDVDDFVFNPLGHGWHLDRPAFDRALLDAVERDGVRVVRERVRSVRETGFVVDATGRSARIARSLDARRTQADRLVATFRPAPRTGSTTTVEASENGWSYTAPGITAFLTDADLLPSIPGTVTNASTSWLDTVAGPGWVAAGDAAVAFDPLSSQGIVTALVMGREAGRVAAGLATPSEYTGQYESLLLEHLALATAYYGIEERWPTSPFWARRRGRIRTGTAPSSTVAAR